LLEYQVATGSACVLLVDPDAQRVMEVGFPVSGPSVGSDRGGFVGAFTAALVLAALIVYGLRGL
jgi:hypothetical protein